MDFVWRPMKYPHVSDSILLWVKHMVVSLISDLAWYDTCTNGLIVSLIDHLQTCSNSSERIAEIMLSSWPVSRFFRNHWTGLLCQPRQYLTHVQMHSVWTISVAENRLRLKQKLPTDGGSGHFVTWCAFFEPSFFKISEVKTLLVFGYQKFPNGVRPHASSQFIVFSCPHQIDALLMWFKAAVFNNYAPVASTSLFANTHTHTHVLLTLIVHSDLVVFASRIGQPVGQVCVCLQFLIIH